MAFRALVDAAEQRRLISQEGGLAIEPRVHERNLMYVVLAPHVMFGHTEPVRLESLLYTVDPPRQKERTGPRSSGDGVQGPRHDLGNDFVHSPVRYQKAPEGDKATVVASRTPQRLFLGRGCHGPANQRCTVLRETLNSAAMFVESRPCSASQYPTA